MTKHQSLARQIGTRLMMALLLSASFTLSAGFWFNQRANDRAAELQLDRAREHYANVIADMEIRWGREAYNLKARLEHLRILEDPAQRSVRLRSFIISQGDSPEFPFVMVNDHSGTLLAQNAYGSLQAPDVKFKDGENAGWAYDPIRLRLYKVFRQEIWLGDRNGELLLYKPMDHALVTRMSSPDTHLYLFWSDQPIATSQGNDGLASAGVFRGKLANHAEPYFLPWHGLLSDGPRLLIEPRTTNAFTIGELAIPLGLGTLIFAFAAWVILGRWSVANLHRLLALEHANQYFVVQRRVSGEVRQELQEARKNREDELSVLSRSLETLMTETVERETAQKSIEHSLRNSEERFRAMAENSVDWIWETDLEGKYLYSNHRVSSLIGYEPREFLVLTPASLIHPYDLPQYQAMFTQALVSRSGWRDVVIRWRHKNGGYRILDSSATPVFDHDGMLTGFQGADRDITEARQKEEELRIAATAFESQEGMVITDANSVILRVNQSFCEITGYSAEELVGQTPQLLKSGRQDAQFYAAMWEGLKSAGVWQGEIWNRRKSGEIYPEWLTITAVKGDDGRISHYVGAILDITRRKAAEDEIVQLAYFDPLTMLPNRRLLLDRLQQSIATSSRSGRKGALLFIDLDNFKTLNDTAGHDIGDLLLCQVAGRLNSSIREGDSVARLGGDEFVVMLEGLADSAAAAATLVEGIGEKIRNLLSKPYDLSGLDYQCTPSIGVTLYPEAGDSVDEVLKRADLAMYQAKAAGRNALSFFDPDMQAVVVARATLEADLRQGVQKDEFLLYFQPQVDRTGELTGAEVLVRWLHPQRGLVSPAEFIPLAEVTGLILPLGNWVMKTACAQLALWANEPSAAHLTLAVNVSARQFHQPDFVDQVVAILRDSGADPQRLKLELTESLLLEDVEDIIVKMSALKEIGVGFSLDDFGTGYSSLSYLKRLPLDQLKIDQSFVRDMLTDPNDATIARTIVTLAQSLGMAVIAEGVESADQRDFLAGSGCHAYQGYFFGHPIPQASFNQKIGVSGTIPPENETT